MITFLLLGGGAIFYTCFYSYVKTEMRIEAQEKKPWRTYWCLLNVADGCSRYKDQFGKWPDTLDQVVAERPDLAVTSTDAWGRAVVFVPYKESVGYGKVISYGRDGKPGGIGDDQDMEVRFLTDVRTNRNDP